MNPRRHNEIPELNSIEKNHYENLFNMYQDDVYYYNLMRTVSVPDNLDPSVYFIMKMNRPMPLTTLSYSVYGTIKLWWLICVTNNINDTVRPIEAGTILKIITPGNVGKIVEMLKQ